MFKKIADAYVGLCWAVNPTYRAVRRIEEEVDRLKKRLSRVNVQKQEKNLPVELFKTYTPSLPAEGQPAVAIVSFIPPFPLEHGGNRQVIHALARWLKSRGYYVYFVYQKLVATSYDRKQFSPDLVDELIVVGDYIDDPKHSRYLDVKSAYPETTEIVQKLCQLENMIAVIAEYVNIAECLIGMPHNVVSMIHTHDMFSRIAEQRKSENVSTDGLEMTAEQERKLLLHSDVVIALQTNEAKLFKELVPERDVIVLGHTAHATVDGMSSQVVPKTVMIVGSSNPVNRHGFELFLQHAWPKILERVPDCNLRVVGSLGESVPTGTPNTDVLGRLPSLEEEYSRAALVINPVLLGTGLKIKTIEALCHGKALVATSSGVEGIQVEGKPPVWLEANEWDAFAQHCTAVLTKDDVRLGLEESALEFAKSNLSEDAVYGELEQVLVAANKRKQARRPFEFDMASLQFASTDATLPRILMFLDFNSPNIVSSCEALREDSKLNYLFFHQHSGLKYDIDDVNFLPNNFFDLLGKAGSLPSTGRYKQLSWDEKRYIYGLAELKQLSLDAAAELFLFLQQYFVEVINTTNPQYIGVWCEYSPIQFGLISAAKITGVPIVYFEYGVLPGTLIVSRRGQVGLSEIVVDNDWFNSLEIGESDIAHATDVLEKIKKNRINRYTQKKTDFDRAAAFKDKKLLLYAGINDLASGNRPYDDQAVTFHSPYYSGTLEGLDALCEVCEAHEDWHILFKPHPCMVSMCAHEYQRFREHPQVTVVEEGDIYDLAAMADVCLTILSQCIYMFAIENVPSILLGNSEIRGKDCVYEYTGGDLGRLIRLALKNDRASQRDAFVRHAARLLKYFLFNDGKSDWGMPLTHLREFLEAEEFGG